jgi:hypothetical protein
VNRREFIRLLGGAAVAWPLPARSQQPAMPVIGWLDPRSPGTTEYLPRAFREGLKDTGYVDGETVAIEYRLSLAGVGGRTGPPTGCCNRRKRNCLGVSGHKFLDG